MLNLVADLNAIKQGLADAALDFDKVFAALQQISQIKSETELEVNLLTYSTMHLLTCDEYSVRDYTLHALKKLVPKLSVKTFSLCEKQIINYVRITSDEMVLKSILQALKLMIEHAQ